MNLEGKNILLGITGGIAAYKCCELVRKFKKSGANVKVILTPNAKEFVSPLVLTTLSQNKVYCEQFDYEDYKVEHISLAQWADIAIIAPITANTISKLANGICDNLLTTVMCAFDKNKIIAPAMNTNMYNNPVIQKNLKKLKTLGYKIVDAQEGFLACGVEGKGRMAELEDIMDVVMQSFSCSKSNKKIIITAGGTRENLDPVRYIGNYSSGKMGVALADKAYELGFEVTLVSTFDVSRSYKTVKINSANDMLVVLKDEFPKQDYLIMAAAVADFRPLKVEEHKIKKGTENNITIELTKNPDIIAEIAKIKTDSQIIVGFCAETQDLINNASKKIEQKHIDYIVANDISRKDIGFSSDYNEVTILDKNGNRFFFEKNNKEKIAENIIETCLK